MEYFLKMQDISLVVRNDNSIDDESDTVDTCIPLNNCTVLIGVNLYPAVIGEGKNTEK